MEKPDFFQELMEQTKTASNGVKNLEGELKNLRTTIAQQGREISRLNNQLEKFSVLPATEPVVVELITLEDAAELYKVHETTLRRWVKRGQLNPVRKGSKMYFRKNDLVK